MTAEAQIIADRHFDVRLARHVWNVVEIAFWIWSVQVDRWRDNSLFERQTASRSFNAASRAKQVSRHRFRRRNR